MGKIAYQMSLSQDLFPYEYIIDTCSFLAQKETDKYPRDIHKSLWNDIDKMIHDRIIVVSRENLEEIDDDDIKKALLLLEPAILEVNEEIQINVRNVVKRCPALIDFAKVKSSADAFLIATAMKYDLTVITEESNKSPKKIPGVCKELGVKCIDILDLCRLKGWSY